MTPRQCTSYHYTPHNTATYHITSLHFTSLDYNSVLNPLTNNTSISVLLLCQLNSITMNNCLIDCRLDSITDRSIDNKISHILF